MKTILLMALKRHIWINPISSSIMFFIGTFRKSQKRRMLFLDIDGTIWEDHGPGTIFKRPKSNPETLKAVKEARRRGFSIIIITNQTYFCYQDKLFSKDLIRYFTLMTSLVFRLRATALLVCHHHPDSNFSSLRFDCLCRKPSPKMLEDLRAIIPFDSDNSIFVGDRITDAACATLSGINNIFLVKNSRMLERNIQGSTVLPKYLIFSLIQDNNSNSFIFE